MKIKTVAKLNCTVFFYTNGWGLESFSIKFYEFLIFRWVTVKGSEALKILRLWKSTELYAFAIQPWIRHMITNEVLLQEISYFPKEVPIDSNVIRKPRSFWNKSTGNQNEV